jgi:hypothetical protein
MLQPPSREQSGDEFPDAEVQIPVKHDVVARRQRLKHGQACRHAGTEGDCLYPAFEIGQALFERTAIGVVDAAVKEVPGESAIWIAFKRGRGVKRHCDRAGGWVHMPPGMDALGLKLLVGVRRHCHNLSLVHLNLAGRSWTMPEKEVVEQAKEDLKEGKSPSTAAGEFVREEIEHVREGKHGARSPQQAIAIGLSKARRAGVPLAPPKAGKTSEATRENAARDYRKGQSAPKKKTSAKRSRASEQALKKEPHSTASHKALSAHAKKAAKAR